MKRSEFILFKALGYSKKRKRGNSLSDGSNNDIAYDTTIDTDGKNRTSFVHEAPSSIPVKPKACDGNNKDDLVVLDLPLAPTPMIPCSDSSRPEKNKAPQTPAQPTSTLLTGPPRSPEKNESPLPPTHSPSMLLEAPPRNPENNEVSLPPTQSPSTLLADPPRTPEKNEVPLPPTQSPSMLLADPPRSPENNEVPLLPTQSPLTLLADPPRTLENNEVPLPPTQSPFMLLADPPTSPEKNKVPLLPTQSPLTLLADPPRSPEKNEALLPPAQSPRSPEMYSPMPPTYLPVTPLAGPPKSIESIYESPMAPAYSPFTPLAGPPKSIESINESPMAPAYSPLTPLVVQRNRTKNFNDSPIAPISPQNVYDCMGGGEIFSPLPAMSPSTLELFNTLNGDFTLEMEKTNEDNIMEDNIVFESTKEEHIKLTKPNSQMDEQHQVTDFSSDTDSDYIPDTDESEDKVSRPKSRKVFITTNAMVHTVKSDKINCKDRLNKERDFISNENTSSQEPIFGDQIEISVLSEAENERETNTTPEFNCNPGAETECSNVKGRPKKGRKRKFLDYTLAERKQRKYANLSYHGKNKQVEPKTFKDYSCTCAKQCHMLVSVEKRQEEFQKYITLGSYEAQLLYITKCVSESAKKRAYTVLEGKKTGKKRPKQFHRVYKIYGTQVCRDMFVNIYQITPKKIDVCMKKNRTGILNDRRGQTIGGWNKSTEEDLDFIKKLVNSLPKYESHYRREETDCQYLKVGMTIEKLYKIYVDELKKEYGEAKMALSSATFKREFYKNFNLRCKSLKKDTCNRCDAFDARIKNVISEEERSKLQREREAHLNTANSLRQNMKNDLKSAKIDETFECLTYDLEKTLPLPRIPTNIVFYKRQLWLYNCGIHAGSSDIGYCYVWVEGDAGRGSQEVGSCLTHFIKNKLSSKVEHLVLWSDCCGGQNRNIKMVVMLKAVLNSHDTLKSITLKYLESGHTFLPNDTDFSKIETQLKQHERIYTADEYINVMKNSKKKIPLQVRRMQKNDFISIKAIEKKIVNRKVDVTKKKVCWLTTKAILIKKEFKHSFFMKNADCEDLQEVYIGKRIKGTLQEISQNDFALLWPNGKEIAQAKLDDLKSMFDLIPKDCLDFYERLLPLGNAQILEDIDGFNSLMVDFEVDADSQV